MTAASIIGSASQEPDTDRLADVKEMPIHHQQWSVEVVPLPLISFIFLSQLVPVCSASRFKYTDFIRESWKH